MLVELNVQTGDSCEVKYWRDEGQDGEAAVEEEDEELLLKEPYLDSIEEAGGVVVGVMRLDLHLESCKTKQCGARDEKDQKINVEID